MSDRYDLAAATDRLRAAAVKAGRELHRAQPISPAAMYADLVDRLDAITDEIKTIAAAAAQSRPAGA